MLARHIHGLGSALRHAQGDRPLISYTGANASYLDAEYLYTDRLGSVIARYRRDGTPAAINGYDEYGVPGPSSGVNNNGRFRYTGQVWLPELGLYYYKARMYSPTIGRFMQTDPIGYADGMNLYAYVGNDPVNGIDPTGLFGEIREPTKTCTGTRIRRALSYDCNGQFAGTGPMSSPSYGFGSVIDSFFNGGGGGGGGSGGGGGRGGSTASCSGGPSNVINVCGSPNRGFAANNIGDIANGIRNFLFSCEINSWRRCQIDQQFLGPQFGNATLHIQGTAIIYGDNLDIRIAYVKVTPIGGGVKMIHQSMQGAIDFAKANGLTSVTVSGIMANAPIKTFFRGLRANYNVTSWEEGHWSYALIRGF